MPSSKVRFSIITPSQKSEIFSVEERKNGELIILIKKSSQISTSALSTDFSDVSENKITVHRSEKSSGFIFNHHSKFLNESYQKISTFIQPRHSKLLWPLISISCPDLSISRYFLKQKIKDQVFSIEKYDPRSGVLVYSIVIASKNVEFGIKEFNGLFHDFNDFRLYIFWMYLTAPSFQQGQYAISITAEPSLNGRNGKILNPDRKSMKPHEISKYISDTFISFGANHAKRLIRFLKKDDGQLSDEEREGIIEYSRWFTKEPILDLDELQKS